MSDRILGCSPSTIRRNRAKRVKTHMQEIGSSSISTNFTNNHTNVSFDTEGYSSSCEDPNSESECVNEPAYLDFPFYFSDSSDNSTRENNPCLTDFKSDLSSWCLKYNIATTAVSELLKMLRNFDTFKTLPMDGRTLLKTEKQVILSDLADGKFCYFGIEKNICRQFELLSPDIYQNINELSLEINVDGLPLTKSTRSQLWPIQCSVVNFNNVLKPFVAAVYYGTSKPSDVNEFFNDLIRELSKLSVEGLTYNLQKFNVKLLRIVADAPARSFLKQCKIHNSYHGCEKCTVRGTYEGRVVFSDLNMPLRTDNDFAMQVDKKHHLGVSPFTRLGFGLVSGVPIDYMHLICLGVTKKLLRAWVKGPVPYKISNKLITQISSSLCELSHSCPKDFNRRPRSLKELDMWKATEFRTFLLFTGPVVLKCLPSKLYKHFMLLSVAITILVSPIATNLEWNKFAQNLLYKFVKLTSKLYSSEFLVYNVHNLIHLCNDVLVHGPLDSFSAFKYENNMQSIKRTLRAKYRPFEQIVNRICELDYIFPTTKCLHSSIKATCGNNCYLLKCGSVVIIINIDENILYCRKFKSKDNFFVKPCESQKLHIYLLSDLSEVSAINESDVIYKCWLLPYKNKFVSIPLVNWNK